MKSSFSIVPLGLVIALLAACAGSKPPARPEGTEELLPQTVPEIGWALEGSVAHYDRGSLFQYINGGAELFLSYGFRRLVTGTYVREAAPDEFVVADVYDMGRKLNAFGVYAAHRSADSPALGVGAEGFCDRFLLVFYKGPYFVHLTLNTANETHIERIARQIADRIEADALPPAELAYLPQDHQVKGTLAYCAEALLGYRFLPRGIHARYDWDGEQVTAFAAFFDTPEAALGALARFATHVIEAGSQIAEDTGLERPGFFAEEPDDGWLLVIQQGRFLVGVRELRSIATAYPLITSILARLPAK